MKVMNRLHCTCICPSSNVPCRTWRQCWKWIVGPWLCRLIRGYNCRFESCIQLVIGLYFMIYKDSLTTEIAAKNRRGSSRDRSACSTWKWYHSFISEKWGSSLHFRHTNIYVQYIWVMLWLFNVPNWKMQSSRYED